MPVALIYHRVEANAIAYADAIALAVAETNVLADAYDYSDANGTLETYFLDVPPPTQYWRGEQEARIDISKRSAEDRVKIREAEENLELTKQTLQGSKQRTRILEESWEGKKLYDEEETFQRSETRVLALEFVPN